MCDGDAALRREVEALLEHEAVSPRFLETPVALVASDVLERPDTNQMIGRQLGPCVILAPLGTDGMGEVYRGAPQQVGA